MESAAGWGRGGTEAFKSLERRGCAVPLLRHPCQEATTEMELPAFWTWTWMLEWALKSGAAAGTPHHQ